jgi:hypothetical protein
MDVQEDPGVADPVTAVVPRVPAAAGPALAGAGAPGGPISQGQLFSDTYPTYADTDQLPAVSKTRPPRPHRDGVHRALRVAVVAVGLAVLAAATALGLVTSGVLTTGGATGSPSTSPPAATPHPTGPTSTAPVATQTSTGNGTATYAVGYAIYDVTVHTSTGRSWVSIGAVGQPPRFAGIVAPSSAQRVLLLGPSSVEVGAGGTTVTVTIGKRSTTLTPPSAPFTYQFEVAKRS